METPGLNLTPDRKSVGEFAPPLDGEIRDRREWRVALWKEDDASPDLWTVHSATIVKHQAESDEPARYGEKMSFSSYEEALREYRLRRVELVLMVDDFEREP